jgi:hypothetical protein
MCALGPFYIGRLHPFTSLSIGPVSEQRLFRQKQSIRRSLFSAAEVGNHRPRSEQYTAATV